MAREARGRRYYPLNTTKAFEALPRAKRFSNLGQNIQRRHPRSGSIVFDLRRFMKRGNAAHDTFRKGKLARHKAQTAPEDHSAVGANRMRGRGQIQTE